MKKESVHFVLDTQNRYAPNEKDHFEFPENVALGTSRIGGHCLDVPPKFEYPGGCFMAQIDLEALARISTSNLLPQTGFLFFFIDSSWREGLVQYYDCHRNTLERVSIFNEELPELWFNGTLEDGVVIKEMKLAIEDVEDRFKEITYDEDENEDDYDLEDRWDSFGGMQQSKMFGFYANCQFSMEETLEVIKSDTEVLLQIGEDYTNEGSFTVLIDKEDLRSNSFEKAKFEWSGT